MATNLAIDDALLAEAKMIGGHKTNLTPTLDWKSLFLCNRRFLGIPVIIVFTIIYKGRAAPDR